jgi:7-cyano-7-deazaguanine synthase
MNHSRQKDGRAPLAVVVLSGGQDSTTCLAQAIMQYGRENIRAVTFNYGQRHLIEIEAAERIADLAGLNLIVQHEVIRLSSYTLKGTSPLLASSNERVESYKDAASLPGGLEKTFVPMRNQLFLTLAINRAVLFGLEKGHDVDVITGVSQEDYGGYPDCRLRFISALARASELALDEPSLPNIHIETPLMFLDKAATVRLSESIPMARELLAYSHTCYNGVVPPCGHCHACLLRARGYQIAGFTDPLIERLGAEHVA